jgi:hypothetical protein
MTAADYEADGLRTCATEKANRGKGDNGVEENNVFGLIAIPEALLRFQEPYCDAQQHADPLGGGHGRSRRDRGVLIRRGGARC